VIYRIGGKKRPRPVVATQNACRPLLEAFEARILLCALHDEGGEGVHITFIDGLNAPVELHVDPDEPTGMVGPTTADLQSQQTDLFTPITGWATAANGLPILNSLPGAPTSIYLDFDGDTGSSTSAYSEDADLTTYNATEQTHIVEAWRQITAYFAMFDTNVTTQFVSSAPKAWEWATALASTSVSPPTQWRQYSEFSRRAPRTSPWTRPLPPLEMRISSTTAPWRR